MAAAKRQKREHSSTAAYAASQPLFDALRTGTARIGEQEFHLTQARDLVQSSHVNFTDANHQGVIYEYGRYVDCTVKAWKSALDVYTDIFEELVKITAPDAGTGKEAAQGHDHFRTIAETVSVAKKAATSFQLRAELNEADPQRAYSAGSAQGGEADTGAAKGDEDAHEIGDDGASIPRDQPCSRNPRGKRSLPGGEQLSGTNDHPPQKARKLSASGRSGSQASKTGLDKSTARYEQAGQKRQKKSFAPNLKQTWPEGRPDRTYRKHYGSLDDGAHPELSSIGKENRVPGVQYEDVSAEVAARLRAKEGKKAAKKRENKRKRESVDSSLLQAVDDTSQKPRKKRVKTAQKGENVGTAVGKAGKRSLGTTEADGGRRKRKKAG